VSPTVAAARPGRVAPTAEDQPERLQRSVNGHHGRDAPRRGVRAAAAAPAGRRGGERGGGRGHEAAVLLPVRGRARRAPGRRPWRRRQFRQGRRTEQ
jgi:hypothetical protein